MNMSRFHQIFEGFRNSSGKKYKDIFDKLKIFLKTRLIEYIDSTKRTNRGRKRIIDLDRFFTCLFFIAKSSHMPFGVHLIVSRCLETIFG